MTYTGTSLQGIKIQRNDLFLRFDDLKCNTYGRLSFAKSSDYDA